MTVNIRIRRLTVRRVVGDLIVLSCFQIYEIMKTRRLADKKA